MSINKVILVGNVGKDPVIRYFDKGVAKVTFPLATSETYTNQQGETITSTEWHNIVLWRALAEVAEKTVKKGSQVYIVGKIKTRSYVDKDGVNKYITEILADALLLLEKKQALANTTAQAAPGKNEGLGNGSPGSVINEPTTSYQVTNENDNKNWPGKGITASDETGIDNPQINNPGKGQNEDDLPF
jgi:single-strand DNA-binding protein